MSKYPRKYSTPVQIPQGTTVRSGYKDGKLLIAGTADSEHAGAWCAALSKLIATHGWPFQQVTFGDITVMQWVLPAVEPYKKCHLQLVSRPDGAIDLVPLYDGKPRGL